MHLFKKHFEFNDSWMWCDWVAHNGFGRPRLSVNCIKQGLCFYFYFTCYKLQWYWVKPKNISYESKRTREDLCS